MHLRHWELPCFRCILRWGLTHLIVWGLECWEQRYPSQSDVWLSRVTLNPKHSICLLHSLCPLSSLMQNDRHNSRTQFLIPDLEGDPSAKDKTLFFPYTSCLLISKRNLRSFCPCVLSCCSLPIVTEDEAGCSLSETQIPCFCLSSSLTGDSLAGALASARLKSCLVFYLSCMTSKPVHAAFFTACLTERENKAGER